MKTKPTMRKACTALQIDSQLGMVVFLGIVLIGGVRIANAAEEFQPYAGVRYERNSNLFALSGEAIAALPPGERDEEDSYLQYVAGLNSDFKWGRQSLSLDLEGRRFQYSEYDELDHNEYEAATALNWTLSHRLDGVVAYRQEQRMAPFAQTISTELLIQKSRNFDAQANYLLGSKWRLEPGFRTEQVDSPQVAYPNFAMREVIPSLGLTYAGFSRLQAGIVFEFVDGEYSGFPLAQKFEQRRQELTLTYRVGTRTTLDASVGYTEREERIAEVDRDTSAVTGSLGYTRQLSAKTQLMVKYNRGVNSYVTAGSSVLDTSYGVGLQWDPTQKVKISILYARTDTDFQTSILDPINEGRKDKADLVSGRVMYSPVRWLSVSVYGNYDDRQSNTPAFAYRSAVAGLELLAHLGAR